MAWLICISNALISMHINDSNATEPLSEKTDHGSMGFGHRRDNVQAVRLNRLPHIVCACPYSSNIVLSAMTLIHVIHS